MSRVPPLPPEALRRRTDPAVFPFDTTADLPPGREPVGQPRAVAAVRFAVAVGDHGFNVFAIGPNGTGKRHFVAGFLTEAAAARPVPPDLCALHNFDAPNRPLVLAFPAGAGRAFRDDMARLVDEVAVALPAAFEAEDVQARIEAIEAEFKERSSARLEALQRHAAERSVAVVQTPMGMMFAPSRDGQVVEPEAFARLPEEEQGRWRAAIEALQAELEALLHEMPRWQRERRARVREFHREVGDRAVGGLVDDLAARYADVPRVAAYLDAVRRDLIDHAREIVRLREGVEADLLRAGAVHRAHGGFLVLDALKVLQQPFAWDGLKRALRAGSWRIEAVGEAYGLLGTATLEPESVPLDVKVVLLGDRRLYYLLCELDPDVPELFKVAADFDDVVDRDPDHERRFAGLVAAIAEAHQLRPFDRGAVAAAVEDAARRAGDAERLSANSGALADLLREANHWAGAAGRAVVTAEDVEGAVRERRFRADRLDARLREAMLRGTLLVATEGAHVGQVNGLSVFELAGQRFGRPQRITARVRLGRGEVVDIEREVALGGPIHSKGVLILASYLAARFGAERPLSLSASLVFEQSYGGIEGDSASAAELYALLSAIADVPLRQGLATTGSVNQFGEIQPVGAVDEKIEGFFDLCAARGLTGGQGVLIPAANVRHLMVRRDVIDAVAAGRFHVYPVATVQEGVELLMEAPFGERAFDGSYPDGSVGARVAARLERFAEAWARHDGRGRGREGS